MSPGGEKEPDARINLRNGEASALCIRYEEHERPVTRISSTVGLSIASYSRFPRCAWLHLPRGEAEHLTRAVSARGDLAAP